MKKEIKHINLDKIETPNFVKSLSYNELEVLSNDIREHLIKITSENGGHLASNLGVVEATISLCRTFNFEKDKIIFDVGHQSYVYKILTGRPLHDLRQKDGTSGFQKRSESKFDAYEAGHSSTSISAASGLATARDLNKDNYDIIAFIGDSSFTNGLSLEALNNLSQQKHKIIIVLNDNEMSISPAVGGISKIFAKFSTSNFYLKSKHYVLKKLSPSRVGRAIYRRLLKIKNAFKRTVIHSGVFNYLDVSLIGPVDGHNIKDMDKAFAKAKRNNKTTLILIKTIKGKGYQYSEDDQTGHWHGVSPFDIKTGKPKVSPKTSWSEYYASILEEEMSANNKIITITPGTGYGSALTDIANKYPSRYIDVGIAEEHAFTFASGLAIEGYHPTISIYSTFLQRAYDQLSHDVARMNLDVTILIDRAGLVGNDGDTHQGIYDEAFLSSIPNMVITMPSNNMIAKAILKESYNHHGPFVIRYPRETVTESTVERKIKFGDFIEEVKGKDLAIVSVGPITEKLKEEVEKEKYPVSLYNAVYLKPINEEAIKTLLKYKTIIIYDCYGTENGFASYLSLLLNKYNYQGKIIIKAIPDQFVSQASIAEQREQFGLTIKDIIKLI